MISKNSYLLFWFINSPIGKGTNKEKLKKRGLSEFKKYAKGYKRQKRMPQKRISYTIEQF